MSNQYTETPKEMEEERAELSDQRILVSSKFGLGGRIINWSPLERDDETEEMVIPSDMIEVTLPAIEVERFVRDNGHKKYRLVDGTLVYDGILPDYRGTLEIENELTALEEEMQAMDYRQFKWLRDEISADEWNKLKEWYAAKRKRHNELEEELSLILAEEK